MSVNLLDKNEYTNSIVGVFRTLVGILKIQLVYQNTGFYFSTQHRLPIYPISTQRAENVQTG